GTTGAALCLAGILAALETVWERFVYSGHTWVHNNPFILLAVFLFLAGVQLIMMGLLAEIGIRTFHEAAGRAPYSIRERGGAEKRASLARGLARRGLAGHTRRAGAGRDDRPLRRMPRPLVARGPDAEGYLLDGPVALGHRRLKIIDLEGGAQPLANEDETVWT